MNIFGKDIHIDSKPKAQAEAEHKQRLAQAYRKATAGERVPLTKGTVASGTAEDVHDMGTVVLVGWMEDGKFMPDLVYRTADHFVNDLYRQGIDYSDFDAGEFAKLADEFLAQEPDEPEAKPEPEPEPDIYTVLIDGEPIGFVDDGSSIIYGYGPDPGAPIGSLRNGLFVASQPWHRHEFDGKPVELVAVRQQ